MDNYIHNRLGKYMNISYSCYPLPLVTIAYAVTVYLCVLMAHAVTLSIAVVDVFSREIKLGAIMLLYH